MDQGRHPSSNNNSRSVNTIRGLAYADIASIVIFLPFESQSADRCTMSIIGIRMQVYQKCRST
jgi:hypothetical protein